MDPDRFRWLKGCGWKQSSILRASREELDRLCAAGRRSTDPVGPISGVIGEVLLPHKGGLVPVVVTGNWLPYDPGDWESPPDGGYYEDAECWIRRRSGWITLQLTREQEQWLIDNLPDPGPYFREPDDYDYDYPLPKWL